MRYKMLKSGRLVPVQNKYGNKREGGFDSKGERGRWQELQLLEKAHKLSNLRRQTRWVFVVNEEPICYYVADFEYWIGDVRVVEDYKSEHTRKLAVYRIKKKLFQALYPDVVFRELVR